MGIDQMLNHARIGQGRDIAQGVVLSSGNLAQDAAHDLARTGLGQAWRPLDDIR
ncbi:hypothetical protein D3C80_2035240 [compost metagenome]